MKALITGANGTVGTALQQQLTAANWQIATWDRSQIPIDDYAIMENFVREQNPDVLFHLATASQPTGRENESWLVNYEWTSELAWICRQLDVRFVFTSTVMVFTDDAIGAFTPDSVPDASEGYGYEKLQAEQRTRHQNPDAIIARLGWQIGESTSGNHMLSNLTQQMADNGKISASDKWYPACSFLTDTADALIALSQMDAGLYLVDSNTKWTFYEIVQALKAHHNADWVIEANEDFVYDQRMIDARVPIAKLDERLSRLS